MTYLIISIAIQVALIIHCVRTGRNMLWIWAIALLPLVGTIAYVLVEIVPALFTIVTPNSNLAWVEQENVRSGAFLELTRRYTRKRTFG